MKITGLIAIAFAVMGYCGSAQAEPLTWDSCVREAARSNAELQSAVAAWQSSDYSASAAYSGFLPVIEGSLTYNYGVANGASGETQYGAALNASQNLFSGFVDQAKAKQAAANRDVAKANLDATRAKIGADLKNAFSELARAQDLVKLAADIIERRKSNLGLVQLRFDSGRENKGSLLLSKAYLEDARLAGLEAENAMMAARDDLARVLGRDSSDGLSVAGDTPVSEPGAAVDFRALAVHTPEYEQTAGQERSADAGVTIARSGFFPSLNLTGTTGRTGPEWFPQNSRWSVELGLSIPLFRGGKDYFSTRSATSAHRSALFSLENTLKSSVTRLRGAWNGYVESVARYKVHRTYLDAAEVRADIGRAKYNNGLLSFEDWDLIENDLIARQKNFLQSKRDRVSAEAAWDQVRGQGVIP